MLFNNKNEVDLEKRKMVENYINETYSKECKITKSEFNHNEEGFTGGMFIYYFEMKDKNNEKFIVEYTRYDDLSKNTLKYIKFNLKSNNNYID